MFFVLFWNLASEFQKNSFAPRIEWKRQRLGTLTFAEIVKETMDLKVAARRPNRGSFTTIIQTIFGLSGGGVHCKGISLEIQEGSLTTATRDVCLQLCNCKEEVAPIKTGEHFVSHLVALGPNKNSLKAPAKLYIPLEDDVCTDHELFLRWSPTHVGEPTKWKDVLPGTCKGKFAGPTVRLQIIGGQQAKISTNAFGLFCIISRESTKAEVHVKDDSEVKTGGFLPQGISGIIRIVGQKIRSEISERLDRDKQTSEQIALIR